MFLLIKLENTVELKEFLCWHLYIESSHYMEIEEVYFCLESHSKMVEIEQTTEVMTS